MLKIKGKYSDLCGLGSGIQVVGFIIKPKKIAVEGRGDGSWSNLVVTCDAPVLGRAAAKPAALSPYGRV